jgi:endoglycosylceramidase
MKDTRIAVKAGRRVLVVLCGLLVAMTPTARAAGGPDVQPLHRAGQWMVDADGRIFVGHGFNIVKKLAPFVRSEFSEADARLLADEGFTVARVGFIWEGVEPEPGRYDDAYIAKVIALNALLAKYGIRTVVDFHQDAWSQYASVLRGDGAPKWATPYPNALDDFQAFWDDEAGPDGVGLQTHFIKAWQHVVTVFGRDPSVANVIAWDPLNEPYAGTKTGCAPFTPCPHFESGALADFYRRIIPAIRAAGGTQVIHTEAIADSGDTEPFLPAFDDPQVAFHYHYYCNATQVSSRKTSVGDGSPESRACQPIEANNLGNYHSYLNKLGVPGFLGEFSCNDVNDDNAQVVDITDAAFDSWTSWAYYTAAEDPADCPGQGLLVDDKKPGVAKEPKLDAFAVPHAQAIAGTPKSTSLDRTTKTYKLTYSVTAVRGAPLRSDVTQIFVPQRMYPKGYVAAVKGGEVVSPSGAPWLLVRASRGEVSVTVTPRKDGRTQRPLETGVLPVRGEGSPESAQQQPSQSPARACSGRRSIVFHLPRSARKVTVTVGGRRVKARRKGRRLTVRLVRRTGTVRVRLIVRTKRGHRYTCTRAIRLCP